LQVASATLRQPARPYGYRGLKIFASLRSASKIFSAGKKADSQKGGLKGGKARAEKLTPEERSEIAKKAAAARWTESSE